jgi:uncharacterized Zn-binding protein involved in type VI secretion
MKIIGWIRKGDKTACGGVVAEGLPNWTSHGREIAFQGARIDCHKGCVIADGYQLATLPNGRPMVHHGMVTSGGCPCYSTLNDVHGVGNASGEAIADRHVLDAGGKWVSVKEPVPQANPYDERPQLVAPPIEGVPYHVETPDGRTFSGRTGADGLLPRIDTEGEDEYAVYWGDEALTKTGGSGA